MERWSGRVALVTGASVGIGASICRELVKHGLKVVGCARDVDKIRAIAEESELKSAPGSLHAIKCDLTQELEILSMFEDIRKIHGHIDVCINNAGMSKTADLLNGKTEDWKSMIDVNVLALCICSREAIKLMQENKIDDGQIIQISSLAGHRIPPLGVNFYSGTKFMVRALTEGLRKELRAQKSHIRVASISPGLVESEFIYRMNTDNPDKVKQFYSSMKCIQPNDIATTVINILQMPPHVDINDILIRPIDELA